MKKFFYLLLCLPLLLASCEETKVDEPVVKEPVVKLSTQKMEFLSDGGSSVISYTIENEKEGAELTAECKAGWIKDLEVNHEHKEISFTVALNEGRERETNIVVAYDTVSVEVAVKQYSDGGDHTTELILEPADKLVLEHEMQKGEIGYTIKSPIDGVDVVVECDAEWISGIAVGEESITFDVAANEGELRRETTMHITYDTLAYEVAITQYSKTDNDTVELTMDWATRAPSSDYGLPNNYFLINFGDNNEILHFQLALMSTTGSDVLQAGTYTLITEDLLLDGTQLYILTESSNPYTFNNGRVNVAVEENIYTFDVYLTGNDGRAYHITYEGEVARMAVTVGDETAIVPYAVVAVAWWSAGNFTIELYTNMAYCHSLDMYDLVGNSKDYLAEGVYVLAEDGGNGLKQYISSSGSKFYLGGDAYDWLAEAEIEIKHNNKRTTTIKGYMKTLSGVVATIDWTGYVDGFELAGYVAPEPDVDVEMTASYFKGDYYPASMGNGVAHNYYFTLSDMPINRNFPAPNSVNFNIDLYSSVATEDNTIPQGTYTFDASNSMAVGTAGGDKTLGFKVDASGDKHSKDYKFVDGTIEVGQGRIDAVFTTETGKKVTLHYEGDLTTLPYSEDNNYDYASRLNGDVELNLTNVTVDAYNSKNYYKTEVADYWQVTLYEDEAHRSGVKIFLAFLACKDYERWWDIDYRSVDISKVGANGNPNDFMNSFIGGYLAGNVPAASWYQVLNGEGQPSFEMAPIVDGTISVKSNDDGSKTIVLDCVDDAGHKIKGTVTTKPAGY